MKVVDATQRSASRYVLAKTGRRMMTMMMGLVMMMMMMCAWQ